MNDGPIVTELENVLQRKNVKHQAYHSSSFIGNHCHKILQVCFIYDIYHIQIMYIHAYFSKWNQFFNCFCYSFSGRKL